MTFDQEEDAFIVRTATFLCLMCLFVLFWAMWPVTLALPTSWNGWWLLPLFTLVPIRFTSLILYHSAWHQEWSRNKRLLLSSLAACLIFGFNVFLLVMIAAIAASLPRLLAGH